MQVSIPQNLRSTAVSGFIHSLETCGNPQIRDLKELYVLAYRSCRLDAALYYQETN